MNPTKIKFNGRVVGIVLAVVAFGVYAEESNEPVGINKDQVEGRALGSKGAAKEATGKVRDDKGKEKKGKAQKHIGKTRADNGDRKRAINQDIKNDQ